ncbi:hypothetical protein BDR06DRAFT_78987 [Suillus hirtellus]|nr:hypothetical protein BDR06DRAFT_78987 [Suillus hirtellus]
MYLHSRRECQKYLPPSRNIPRTTRSSASRKLWSRRRPPRTRITTLRSKVELKIQFPSHFPVHFLHLPPTLLLMRLLTTGKLTVQFFLPSPFLSSPVLPLAFFLCTPCKGKICFFLPATLGFLRFKLSTSESSVGSLLISARLDASKLSLPPSFSFFFFCALETSLFFPFVMGLFFLFATNLFFCTLPTSLLFLFATNLFFPFATCFLLSPVPLLLLPPTRFLFAFPTLLFVPSTRILLASYPVLFFLFTSGFFCLAQFFLGSPTCLLSFESFFFLQFESLFLLSSPSFFLLLFHPLFLLSSPLLFFSLSLLRLPFQSFLLTSFLFLNVLPSRFFIFLWPALFFNSLRLCFLFLVLL